MKKYIALLTIAAFAVTAYAGDKTCPSQAQAGCAGKDKAACSMAKGASCTAKEHAACAAAGKGCAEAKSSSCCKGQAAKKSLQSPKAAGGA